MCWLDIQGARLTSTVCSLWLPPCSTALAKLEAPSSPTSKSTENSWLWENRGSAKTAKNHSGRISISSNSSQKVFVLVQSVQLVASFCLKASSGWALQTTTCSMQPLFFHLHMRLLGSRNWKNKVIKMSTWEASLSLWRYLQIRVISGSSFLGFVPGTTPNHVPMNQLLKRHFMPFELHFSVRTWLQGTSPAQRSTMRKSSRQSKH